MCMTSIQRVNRIFFFQYVLAFHPNRRDRSDSTILGSLYRFQLEFDLFIIYFYPQEKKKAQNKLFPLWTFEYTHTNTRKKMNYFAHEKKRNWNSTSNKKEVITQQSEIIQHTRFSICLNKRILQKFQKSTTGKKQFNSEHCSHKESKLFFSFI